MTKEEQKNSVEQMAVLLQEKIRETEEYLNKLNEDYCEFQKKYPEYCGCNKVISLLFSGKLYQTTIEAMQDLIEEDEYSFYCMDVEGVSDVVVLYSNRDVIAPGHSFEIIRSCYACHRKFGKFYGLKDEEVEPVMNAMKKYYGKTDITYLGLKLRTNQK